MLIQHFLCLRHVLDDYRRPTYVVGVVGMNLAKTGTVFSRSILRRQFEVDKVQRRFRYKKKWAVNKKQKTSCDLALDYFDLYYKPIYGKDWPAIRISLLSMQKYCALVNNFAHQLETVEYLKSLGAYDIMELAQESKIEQGTPDDQNTFLESTAFPLSCEFGVDMETDPELHEDLPKEASNTDLYDFMPVKKIYSEKKLIRLDEEKQSIYQRRDLDVNIVPCLNTTLPSNLKVYTFRRGKVKYFPPPKASHGLLSYYLLDASSILPVVALDLKPEDFILDLCAAPGGKSLIMLQSLMTERIVCNDISYSRLKRLQDILKWYIPQENQASLEIYHHNGTLFKTPTFDKVLVDVPCNLDRHVLLEENNNLFKPGRIRDRVNLPSVQQHLLVAAILSTKPQGSIVYSTCTLAPSQNDGIIQAAVEQIWNETKIDIVIEDLGPLMDLFSYTFNFHKELRFGRLVLPCLSSNFGPMYICKITRLN